MPRYKVTMPNGKAYSIDGPAGASKQQIIAAVQRRIEASKPETTFGGEVEEAFKGVIPGAAGMLETTAAGVGSILPEEYDKALRAKATELATEAREKFKPALGYEDSFGRGVGEAVGSTVPLYAVGSMGTIGRAASIGMGIASGAGEARMKAEQEGATSGQKTAATALGAAVGSTEYLPIFSFMKRLPDNAKLTMVNRVRRAFETAGEEGAQEAAQQLAQNLIAKGIYKPDQSLVDSVGSSAAYGGTTGAMIQVITDMALGHRARPGQHQPPPPATAEEKLGEPEAPSVTAPGTEARAQEDAQKQEDLANTVRQAVQERNEKKATEQSWLEGLEEDREAEERQRRYYESLMPKTQAVGEEVAPVEEEEEAPQAKYSRQTLREAEEAERLAPEDREGVELEMPAAPAPIAPVPSIPAAAEAVEEPVEEPAAAEPEPETPDYTMRDAALEVMRESGKTNVDTLRNRLAISLPEAKGLRQGLIDEGILVRKGNTYVLKEAVEAPSAQAGEVTDAVRTRDTEKVDTGPVGRGDVLPAQRPVSEGQVPAQPATPTVERASEPLSSVDEGQGRVEPTLEKVEAAQQTRRSVSLRKAALDFVRSTGKASVVALQQALGIPISEAKALRDALIGSGAIVPVPGKKGAYTVFEQTAKSAFAPQAPFRAAREGETAVEGDVETRPTPPTEPLVKKVEPKRRAEEDIAEEAPPKPKPAPFYKTSEERVEALRRAKAQLEEEEAAKLLPPEAAAQQSLGLIGGVAKPSLTEAESKILDSIKSAARFQHQQGNMRPEDIEKYNAEIVKPRPDLKKLKKLIDKVSSREDESQEDIEREETFYGDIEQAPLDEDTDFWVEGPDDYRPLKFQRRPSTGTGMEAKSVKDIVNKVSANWKNKPRITVVQSFEELPENVRSRIPSDAAGAYYRGDVYIVADRAANEAEVRGTLFHESLGHYGLRALFGRRLGEVLWSIYKTNPAMTKAVDKWLKANPDTYAEETRETQIKLAVEEIFSGASEQGQIKDTGIRAAFNRVAALIRRFLRAMRIQVNYSNNDIRQILIQAHGAVIAKERTSRLAPDGTVAAQRKNEEERLSNVFDTEISGPEYTPQTGDKVLGWFGNTWDSVKEFGLGLLSMKDQAEIWSKELPAIKKLEETIERRGSAEAARREEVSDIVKESYKTAQEFENAPEELKNFFKIANMTTIYQVDPLSDEARKVLKKPVTDMTPFDKVSYDIIKAFDKVAKPLRDEYARLRKYYDEKAAEFEKMLEARLGKDVFDRIKAKYDMKKLMVYLPLWRDGNHWLTYTDKRGETIVSAFNDEVERQRAREAAEKNGGKDFKEYGRLRDARKGAPPTGFLGDIVSALEASNVPDEAIDAVYEAYLNYLPAESVRQLRRPRESSFDLDTGVDRYGVFGFEPDIFQAFANVAPRIANQLTNLEYAIPIEETMKELHGQAGGDRPTNKVHAGVYRNLRKHVNNILNPPRSMLSKAYDWAGSTSYFWYIAGNVSSAIVNATQLPMIVAPMLGGKYGTGKAFSALEKAMTTYFNGGKDTNSDFTFGTADNLSPEYKKLYRAAVDRSVIRRSAGYDLTEAKKAGVEDFTGTMSKVKQGLSWVFQNSERFNREVTLLAAFDLAYEKTGSVDKAIEEAIRTTKEAHGSAMAETGPRLFQQGFGRVLFTFKRFGQAQMYLIGKLFNQAFRGTNPNTRRIAARQLLGIYGTSYALAGLSGVPFYGLVEFLANLIMGDDDDPYDFSANFSELNRKGLVNSIFGVDLASRIGFDGLLWREDPRRMAEVGPATYILEQAMGPAYSAYKDATRGAGLMKEGRYERGLEAMTPGFVRNLLKAGRYATEGVRNKDGTKVVDTPDKFHLMMQAIGFTPASVGEARESAGADYGLNQRLLARRGQLVDQYYAAWQEKDRKGMAQAVESIKRFNAKNPQKGLRITSDTISRSIRSRKVRQQQSVDGYFLPAPIRKRIQEIRSPD